MNVILACWLLCETSVNLQYDVITVCIPLSQVEKQSSFVIKRAINNDVSPTSKSPSDSRSSSVVVPDKGGETAPKSRPTSITLSSTPPPDVSAAPSVPCTPPPKDDRSPSLEKKETTPTVEDNDTATPPMMSRLSNGVKKEVPLAKGQTY